MSTANGHPGFDYRVCIQCALYLEKGLDPSSLFETVASSPRILIRCMCVLSCWFVSERTVQFSRDTAI